MATLNIFPNELNKPQEKQNTQINLALTSINSWSNRISNAAVTSVSDDSAQSTTSTGFVAVPNFSLQFKNLNPNILITSTLCLNTNGNVATIRIVVDGAVVAKAITSVAGINIVSISKTITTNVGQHSISLEWSTATGTINKILDGGSSLDIVNLV